MFWRLVMLGVMIGSCIGIGETGGLEEFKDLIARHDIGLKEFARVKDEGGKKKRQLNEQSAEFFSEAPVYIAQEQKRILLLQFYEVILKNKERSLPVDERILKLMTNYLQMLEYVYVKQVQHHEESPPVLYNFKADNETSSFCDSPSVALPDPKFLNQDNDYFLKLFDQYNQQQLGLHKSPSQLREISLFRKLHRHIQQARKLQLTKVRERKLKLNPNQPSFQTLNSNSNQKIDSTLNTGNLSNPQSDLEKDTEDSLNTDLQIDRKEENGREKSLKNGPKSCVRKQFQESQPFARQQNRNLQTSAQKFTRLAKPGFNAFQQNLPLVDDPEPLRGDGFYRENINDDLIEIFQFYINQFNEMFAHMERLIRRNRGVDQWRFKPTWLDFSHAVQYFNALAGPTNRFLHALRIVATSVGNQNGLNPMIMMYYQEERFRNFNQFRQNVSTHFSMRSRPGPPKPVRRDSTGEKARAFFDKPFAARLARRHAENLRRYHIQQNQWRSTWSRIQRSHEIAVNTMESLKPLAANFNHLGNIASRLCGRIRILFIRLREQGMHLVQRTQLDLTSLELRQIVIKEFEKAIPELVRLKHLIVTLLHDLLNTMRQLMTFRPRVITILTQFHNHMHGRLLADKLLPHLQSTNTLKI